MLVIKKKHNGFTLIELVVVIVILGILAAVAAPRFVNLTTDATIARLEAMAGALRSGASIVNARATINNQTSGSDSINVDNTTITTHSGYPGSVLDGFARTVNLEIEFTGGVCDQDWCGLGNQSQIPSGDVILTDTHVGKLFTEGFSYNDQCGVYYVNREDGSSPEVGIETADC